ncbi:MAG: sulfate adenylyltransferase [Proteobacteria bacterium]|nr:sulfate adenylyltransferase [Pseudomonadota bacterium]
MSRLSLSKHQYLELRALAAGAFHPLTGFMNEDQFHSCVEEMRMPTGELFPIPIILDLDDKDADRLSQQPRVALYYEGEEVGELLPDSFYRPNKEAAAKKIFGTDDAAHPGVSFFLAKGDVFVGAQVRLTKRLDLGFASYDLTPEQCRQEFASRGWQTIVGFQTRNVPHRAHEHLQRIGLEVVDGLFIHPLIGYRKRGDYTAEAIVRGYEALIDNFYPTNRVVLGVLPIWMRYAGPREAVFHAIVRRNFGCTHFIIGRDHAGVGNYYGKYEAQYLSRRFDGELGIEVLYLHGPFYCSRCESIVTDKVCRHERTAPQHVTQISGTDMRASLLHGRPPGPHLMRPEIVAALEGVPIFIESDEP